MDSKHTIHVRGEDERVGVALTHELTPIGRIGRDLSHSPVISGIISTSNVAERGLSRASFVVFDQ